jgi:hypothetical protein
MPRRSGSSSISTAIRGACLSAFVDEIRSQRCDAFYVKVNKTLTQEKKAKAVADARKRFDAEIAHDPDFFAGGWTDVKTFSETADQLYAVVEDRVRLRLLREEIRQARQVGPWLDRWVRHPLPTMSEAEKQFCCLTPIDHYKEDRLARVLNRASLHGIDRFFLQLRRRVSLAERPIATPSRQFRQWHGYSPYNPAVLAQVLDIYRCFYNYVAVGRDKRTPAMRLGLTDAPFSTRDLAFFMR